MRAIRRRCAATHCPGIPRRGSYRISVKREDHGQVSQWLHVISGPDRSSKPPRREATSTSSTTQPGHAGVRRHWRHPGHGHGARAGRGEKRAPDLVAAHDAQSAATHAFAAEVTALIDPMPDAHQRVFYTVATQATASRHGRLDRQSIAALGLPTDAAAYLCGPTAFMDDMRDALAGSRGRSRRTSTPNCSAPCRRSTPAWSPRRQPVRPHPPDGVPGPGRESRSPAAGSASTGRRASTPSSNSPRPATCQPDIHAEAASATHA